MVVSNTIGFFAKISRNTIGFAAVFCVLALYAFITVSEPAGVKRLAAIRTKGPVSALAWSPDGQMLATISDFGRSTTIWKADGTRLRELGRVIGPYTSSSLEFLDGGRQLLTPPKGDIPPDQSPWDMAFTVWDVASGTPIRNIYGPGVGKGRPFNYPLAYTVSADGRTVALQTGQFTPVYLYSSESWQLSRTVISDGVVASFDFSPDGKELLVGRSNKIMVVNVQGDQSPRSIPVQLPPAPKRGLVTGLAVSPDGRLVATTSSLASAGPKMLPDHLQVLLRADSTLVASDDQTRASGGKLSWSADGKYLASVTTEGVRIYQPYTPDSRPIALNFSAPAMFAKFSPEGRRLAVDIDREVVIFAIE